MADEGNYQRYDDDDDEINLLDYWRVIWKYRWLIGILCSTSVLAALIFGLLSPKIYESRVTILSPRETGSGGLLSALGAAGIAQQIAGVSIPSLAPNRDLFISVLKSRLMAKDVVERFDLKERYRIRTLQEAIEGAMGIPNISATKEGLIEVKVADTDPKLAAEIANFYAEHLDNLVSRFGTTAVSRQRRFITEQLEKVGKELKAAEEELRAFQEKNRAVSMGQQVSGAIEVAARLKGEIMASEVQLQVMRNFATEANPEVIRLRRRIGELKRQLGQAQYSAGLDLPALTENPGHPQKEIYLPPAKVPKIGLELARLTRDVKVQETVYTLLTQQLEQAKIAESQDTPVVQVLDRAVPAIYKSKPKIRLNMALAGAVSLFLGIFLAFFLEYIQRQRSLMSNVQSPTSKV
jgi:uncharacterized protein involved in exopolysaccharide biosynthesis